MGQIFNRISRIAKAKFSDTKEDFSASFLDSKSEEEELKRAIEELKKAEKEDFEKENKQSREESFDASKKMDIFLASKILDVSTNASFDEVKLAYKQKIKEYHPDKVAALGKELQDLAARKTASINVAFNYFKEKYSK